MLADPTQPESLRIVHYPQDVLRRKTTPVETVDETVQSVARRMIDLMHEAPGIGLAAPQVGLDWRMFVCHVPPFEDDGPEDVTDPPSSHPTPMVCINPVLSDFSRDLEPYEEGCLSLPEILGNVRRPTVCTLDALDIDGKPFTMRAQGLLARCWQHEFDHLEGVLIIDRMDPAGKMKNKRAIRDLETGAKLA